MYKELMSMRKDQVDLDNAVVWIPDSKFKKYSQMKLQMKREALEKINWQAKRGEGFDTVNVQ